MEPNINQIRCELSIAYLKAVTAYVGGSFNILDRVADDWGYDCHLKFMGKFSDQEDALKSISMDIQLKSTSRNFTCDSQKGIGYQLDIRQYNKYRENANSRDINLLLLYICPPEEEYDSWLQCDPEKLLLRKCMYWTSLRGAQESENCSSVTVYFPPNNFFTVESLREEILKPLSEGRRLTYVQS